MEEVEGKVAFVTRGSSGVGLGIARAFVDAGMKVVIGYRTQRNADEAVAQLANGGDRVHAIRVDVTDRSRMEEAAAETVTRFGKVHVLVNNAGVVSDSSLSESTYDDWDWVIGVNLTGIFNGVRAFLPHIKSHGERGQVVTTSSVLGLIACGRLGVYSTSKFAAVGMMEALRAELAPANIGVSVVCPGFVRSNLWDSARNRSVGSDGVAPRRADGHERESGFSRSWRAQPLWMSSKPVAWCCAAFAPTISTS